ncbi:hypothetical protein ASPVEDRAFT_40282 [Aspergillus versicolor CBS 583.65]|uniref:Uncharacterized protein n=1 Tax=Aspergillus versicolor CBS 583.65 TaxID=1036611 RepID=A0A1L9PH11_ASPVE|nr:uncharacterized protein ASPVEDRAFT_40282 [Aspergillus versicolor CBS 583.65]OJJ00746.1 hypothetical protein ASPVEDRAFT_40282 [Aspergillus versicolor CBS 583.65]
MIQPLLQSMLSFIFDLNKPSPRLLPGVPVIPYLAPNYLERVYSTVNDNGSIRLHLPLVVADDGVLGIFVPACALEEHGVCPNLAAQAVGKMWRNSVIASRTVFWWSGRSICLPASRVSPSIMPSRPTAQRSQSRSALKLLSTPGH